MLWISLTTDYHSMEVIRVIFYKYTLYVFILECMIVRVIFEKEKM